MTKFESICLKLQRNFDRCARACYFRPRTPAFTKPKNTKYLSYLNAMLEAPLRASKISSKTTAQALRWSGMCESTKEGYVLTALGKKYLALANAL